MQTTHTSFMTVVNKAQVDAHQPLVTVTCGAPQGQYSRQPIY